MGIPLRGIRVVVDEHAPTAETASRMLELHRDRNGICAGCLDFLGLAVPSPCLCARWAGAVARGRW